MERLFTITCLFLGSLLLCQCKKNETSETPPKYEDSLKTGLWAYYNFNKGSFADKSGNNHTMRGVNNIKFSYDIFGNDNSALQFDGTNNYAVIDDGKAFPDGEFTISFLLMSKTLRGSILQKADYTDGKGSSIFLAFDDFNQNNQLVFSTNKTTTPCTNPINPFTSTAVYLNKTLASDAWYYVTVVYRDSDQRAYINGIELQRAPTPIVSFKHCTSSPFYIGIQSLNNPHPFTGKMDNIRIYSRALSGAEVQYIYLSQKQDLD